MLKDIGFQLQQMKVFSPHSKLSTIATLPISHMDFHAPLNQDAHLTYKYKKAKHHNLAAPMAHGQFLCGQNNCHSISKI